MKDGDGNHRNALPDPGDQGTQRGFATLEALLAFLREELGVDDPDSPGLQRADARRCNPAPGGGTAPRTRRGVGQ